MAYGHFKEKWFLQVYAAVIFANHAQKLQHLLPVIGDLEAFQPHDTLSYESAVGSFTDPCVVK